MLTSVLTNIEGQVCVCVGSGLRQMLVFCEELGNNETEGGSLLECMYVCALCPLPMFPVFATAAPHQVSFTPHPLNISTDQRQTLA